VKPKVFTDGTVCYDRLGMLTTCEPHNVVEALWDKNWKAGMDAEIFALYKNATWHLVLGLRTLLTAKGYSRSSKELMEA
jgi:hypothetical protein